jgi:cyclophilin family peptidyl-prolyl cis-trans isomerase
MKQNIVFHKGLFAVIIGIIAVFSLGQAQTADGLYASITTNKGEIKIKLYFDRTPLTVCNFVGLAEGKLKNTAFAAGVPYFNGMKWHRVELNWVIQSGDPKGNGTGGPGYFFRCEPDTPNLKHDKPGVVGMANTGAGTVSNGSQFYITHSGNTPRYNALNGGYTIFGQVIDTGMNTVMRIAVNDPLTKVTITRVGDKAMAFRADQKMFDSLKALPTALGDQKQKNSTNNPFTVYGNSRKLFINTVQEKNIQGELYSIAGQRIFSRTLQLKKRITPVSFTCAPGIYILRVREGIICNDQNILLQ